MRFAFGYRCGEVCPRECPQRAPGCHNAETCERWAAQRGRSKRMSWESRRKADNG